MGCIMTPMPNHLSTYPYYYISLPLNHKTTHKRVGEKKSGAVWKRCGKGSDVEQMRRMDEMVCG